MGRVKIFNNGHILFCFLGVFSFSFAITKKMIISVHQITDLQEILVILNLKGNTTNLS